MSSVQHIGFTVSDLERSVQFYREVLFAKPINTITLTSENCQQLWGCPAGVTARIQFMEFQVGRLALLCF
ncbi:MAG: VOC family protein, partial [Bacteroidota bacterium]